MKIHWKWGGDREEENVVEPKNRTTRRVNVAFRSISSECVWNCRHLSHFLPLHPAHNANERLISSSTAKSRRACKMTATHIQSWRRYFRFQRVVLSLSSAMCALLLLVVWLQLERKWNFLALWHFEPSYATTMTMSWAGRIDGKMVFLSRQKAAWESTFDIAVQLFTFVAVAKEQKNWIITRVKWKSEKMESLKIIETFCLQGDIDDDLWWPLRERKWNGWTFKEQSRVVKNVKSSSSSSSRHRFSLRTRFCSKLLSKLQRRRTFIERRRDAYCSSVTATTTAHKA